MTGTFLLTARGPFSLAASARFLEGFAPAAHTGTAGQPLDMAFPVEGTWQTAGVRVRDHPGGAECEVVSPAAPGRELLAALRAQVARILSLERALAELRQLPGIGEFSAELILLRGAAAPDELPGHEPRLGRAITLAYSLPQHPSAMEIERISDNWRPYRTWATLLLRTFLEDQTHEIAGQPLPH